MRLRRLHLASVALLVLALAIFYLLVMRFDPRSTYQVILGPWPDAPEYLDGAIHLLEEGRHRIHVGGLALPSRYPFGVSLLQAAYIKMGGAPLDAPFAVSEAAGVLLVVSLWGFLAWRGHWLAAGLAALLLSTRTWLIVLCRSGMSEPPSLLLVLWAALLLYVYADSGRWQLGAVGAFLLALGSSLHLSTVLLFAFPVGAMAAAAALRRVKVGRELVALLGGGLAGSLPLLIYQTNLFGAPWRTGYGFWIKDYQSQVFGLGYIIPNGTNLWLEMLQRESMASVASLFGEGSFFSPSFAILTSIALWRTVRKRPERLGFLAAAALFAAPLLVYRFGIPRLFTPLALLGVPVAASWYAGLWPQTSRVLWLRALWILGFLVVLLGWPGSRSDTDLGDMFKTHPLSNTSGAFAAIEALNRLPSDKERLVITNFNPPYVHALTFGRRRILPMQQHHDYRFNPASFRFGTEDRDRLIRQCAATAGCVVYAIYQRPAGTLLAEMCPPPPGTAWEVLTEDQRLQGLGRLEVQQLAR